MLKRSLFTIVLFLLSMKIATAQQNSPTPDWLANPQLHVTELPDLLHADSTPTDLGALRVVLDTDKGQLLYQYDEKAIQSIQLPAALQKEYATNRITIAPHRPYAIICSVENGEMSFTGTEFAIDFEQHEIIKRGDCELKNWWELNQFGAWEVVSPDTQYRVSVEDGSLLCAPDVAVAVMIESEAEQRLSTCIPKNSLGMQVQFVRWLDDDRLLIKTASDRDGEPPTEENILVSASTGKAISFGDEIGRINSGIFFYKNYHDAARIAVRADNENPDFNVEDPFDCALNLINFDTEQSVDVEHTYCLHDPQLRINEQKQELLYLNSQISGNDGFVPLTTPHIVNLDTDKATVLLVTGTIMNILDVSPDWNQVVLLVDADPQARQGTFWPPGASSVTTYVNPHLMIYDRQQAAVIYDKALRPVPLQNMPLNNPYSPPFGLMSSEWVAEGWRALIRVQGELPLLIEENHNNLHESRLQGDVPIDDEYTTNWSADGEKLLIQLSDRSAYIVDSQDASVIQVLKPSDQFSVDWYGDNQLIVTDESVKRWLINLPS